MNNILFKRITNYLLLVFTLFLTIIILYTNIQSEGDYLEYFNAVTDAMFLALLVLFCKKKGCIYVYLSIITLYILSIVWYFRTYSTIMPLSSYLLIDNLKGLGPSIIHSIRLSDIILILPICLYFIFYEWAYNKWLSVAHINQKFQITIFLTCLLFVITTTSIPYWPNKRPFYEQPLYLFQIISPSAIQKYGIINYWIYQVSTLQPLTKECKEYAHRFIKEMPKKQKVLSNNHKKNLILILVESLQSWPIDLKIEEEEITPYINRTIRDSTTVYFPKVVPQVKDGRSSDAQLLINTGLLPLYTGAASSLCATNTFPSLAFALKEKGYTSISFICDNRTFWNQGHTTIAYGFNKLYDRLQKDAPKEAADENLFKSSLSILPQEKHPFYAQLVTLSSHAPYSNPIITNSPLLRKKIKNDEVRNYLIAIQYVDKCIGNFIEELKEKGLYKNSIIIITGDHEQMTFNNYENRIKLKAEDCFVPFIIINSPLKSQNTDCNFGQMDIYPSLLDLMGCTTYFWRGLGESMFCNNVSNYSTFRTNIATTSKNIPDSVKKYRNECWRISDILLRMDYFRKHHCKSNS